MSQRSRRHRRRGGARSKVLFVAGAVLALVAALAIGVASWVLDVAEDAPSLASCKPVEEGGNSIVFAGDGSKLGVVASDEARTPVALKRMPPDLRQATIAIEDERFYEHDGVDEEAILRAAIKDFEAGEAVEGGSTITQQLVRNLCIPDPDDDLARKIVEAKLAIEYSKRHSKDEILGQYLNTASYGTINGSTAVGVQAASRFYFSEPVWKIDLAQAAMLAGLPQAPTDYNPILNPDGARERRDDVLAKMAELGFITAAEAEAAEERGLGLEVDESFYEHRQPYFFDYVEEKLIEAYGVNTVRQGGLDVHTTIDPKLQEVGLEAMRSALPYEEDPSSAFVSIDPRNGWIRAMVSSSSYDSSQFNLAAQGHRQPGSTFKTFVLTTALKQGIDPYSTYYVSKPLSINTGRWGHWDVHTADEGYLGEVNLQQATVASDNTVFAQLDLDVGPEQVAETAKSMGITSPLDGIPAEGIGGLRIGVSPLEMSSGYATLAAGGIRRDPVAIREVVFPDGRVEEPEKAAPKRVVSEAVAYEVTRLLHDNITEGTGTAAYTGCEGQAGKTGTTDGLTDAWFAGYQPNLSTVVWVGYPESNEIEMTSVHGISVFGGTFPAEIWNSVYANGEVPCETFSEPEKPIVWAPFYGRYTRGGPVGDSLTNATRGEAGELPGQDAVGGYDPNAYAPGVGQEPYVPSAPAPAPAPAPPPSEGSESAGIEGGEESPGGAQGAARGRRRRLAADRQRRRGLRPGLGRVRRLPRRAVGGAEDRPAAGLGRDPAARRSLCPGAGSALPRRLQLRGLRAARRRPRPRPLRPPARRGALRPRLRRGRLDRSDERLRPAFHARELSACLALGRCRRRRVQGPGGRRGPRPRAAGLPARAGARRRPPARRRLRRPQPARPRPRRRRRPQRRPGDADRAARGRRRPRRPRDRRRGRLRGRLRDQGPGRLRRPLRPDRLHQTADGPKARLYIPISAHRRGLAVFGGGLGVLGLVALAAWPAFGWSWLDALGLAGENQGRTSYMSVPITFARLTGTDPEIARIAALYIYGALVAWLLAWTWRGGDWLRAAAWAGTGLLLATAWLLPWYLVWALPFAALSRDRPLQLLVLALTAFQLGTRIPL